MANVKIKIERKAYVRLIMWLNNKDHTAFPQITSIDRLNMRSLYLWCFNRHEQWRNDRSYHEAKKKHCINIEVNHFGTLQKFQDHQWPDSFKSSYEIATLSQICEQGNKQIDMQIYLNSNLVMF